MNCTEKKPLRIERGQFMRGSEIVAPEIGNRDWTDDLDDLDDIAFDFNIISCPICRRKYQISDEKARLL